jgi:flagellar basal body-associated protein FliL
MMDRATKAAIIIFCVVVILMLAMGTYGYWSGAWNSELSPP